MWKLFRYKYNLRVIFISYLFLCLLLASCTHVSPPPLEFAPNGEIVKKALQLYLEKEYKYLSENLGTTPLSFQIDKINVRKIQPTVKFNLPIYSLTGDYEVTMVDGKKTKRKVKNNFTLYLHRQRQGKTWRLFLPSHHLPKTTYLNYLIS